jgi:hypothetical protein
MGKILITPEGEKWEVLDDAEVPQYEAMGWKVEGAPPSAEELQQEKYGDTGSQIRAGAEGLARGITFGLSDPIQTWAGVPAEDLRGRQEANPIISTTTDIAGTVLPAIASFGLSTPASAAGLAGRAVARGVGGAVGKGLVGRLTGAAAAGVVEGGFYGAGRAISEDALDGPDADLTAQKFLAHVGMGSLFGAGGGALGEGASTALSAGLRKVAGLGDEVGDIPAWFREKAERNAVRSIGGLGPTSGDLKGLAPERVQRLGRTLLDQELVGKGSVEIDAVRKVAGKGVGQALQAADDEVAASTVDLAKVLETGRIDVKTPFDLKGFVRRGREEVLKEIAGDPALATEANEVRKLLDGYENYSEGFATFQEANRLKSNLAKRVNFRTDSDLKKQWVAKLRGILDDEIETQVGATAGPETIEAFRTAKATYGDLAEAKKIARHAERRGSGNRSVSLTDYLAGIGGATTGNAGALLSTARGIGFSAVNNWGRTKGSAVMAAALDSLAENKGVARIAEAFQKRVNAMVAETPEALGPYLPFLSAAAGESNAMGLLAAHAMASEQDPQYVAMMASAGFQAQEPGEEGAAYGKAVGLSGVQQVASNTDRITDEMIDGFLDRTRGARSDTFRISAKEYRSHLDKLAQLTVNPQALADSVDPGGSLASVAPAVASQASLAAAQAVQYLHQQAPKPPATPPLPGYGGEWRPGPAELSKYQKKARAVMQPISVLEDLRRGELSFDSVQSLRTVYPRMTAWLAQRYLEKAAESGARLTHQQRLQLSLLLGQNLDPSLDPAVAGVHQQVYAMNAQQMQAEQEKKKREDRASKFKPGDYSTSTQRMEGMGQ